VLDLIGETDKPPSIPGIQIADLAGGGMNAVIGILLALQARTKTGEGQYIDISMTDGCVPLLSLALDFQHMSGQVAKRSDSFLSHRYACYNTYETKDKRYLTIGAVENRFWKKLCEHLGAPEYSNIQLDEEKRVEMIEFMRKTIKSKTFDEWEADFADKDFCWGPVNTIPEVLDEPLFKEREMVVDVEDSSGKKTKTIGIPVKMSETPGTIRSAPVQFGESTEKVLLELGYSSNDVKLFSEEGIL